MVPVYCGSPPRLELDDGPVSRAFIKEPEPADPSCPSPPGCGGAGVPVSRVTLEARLRPEAAGRFVDGGYFCPNPSCEVAYFDAGRERALRDELVVPAWPKHRDAPLCACFGVAQEVFEDFGRRGDRPAMRAFLERTVSPEASCVSRAADGRCCATEARRVFIRALEEATGT